MSDLQVMERLVELEQEVIKLKELNREMVESVKYIRQWYQNGSRTGKTLDDVLTQLFDVLAKAEEGEGE